MQLFVELSDELILVSLGGADTDIGLTKLRDQRLDQTINEFITFTLLYKHELPFLLSKLGHIVFMSPCSVIKLQYLSDVILYGLSSLHLCKLYVLLVYLSLEQFLILVNHALEWIVGEAANVECYVEVLNDFIATKRLLHQRLFLSHFPSVYSLQIILFLFR